LAAPLTPMPRASIATADLPIVIEFFGLPGAGKTTIANCFTEALRARGYRVQTANDFVLWLSQQPKLKKLGFLLSDLRNAIRQLFCCTLFGLRLRPIKALSFSRIVRVPYINLCFERYLDTLGRTVVVMDQANMQLIWSIGAFASRYDKASLNEACTATLGTHLRYYACLTPDPAETSLRLQGRKSNHSRFDNLDDEQLHFALGNASGIVTDLHTILDQKGRHVTVIDATLPPDENSKHLISHFLLLQPFADRSNASF
jgi:hypothetical protein